MSFSRELWKGAVTERGIPPWPCPQCGHTLVLLRESLTLVEQASSIRDREHPYWEPEWIRELFSARARCTECDDLVALIGHARLDDFDTKTGNYGRSLYLHSVYPAPPIISLPETTPEEVKAELHRAFTSFWSDPAGSLNRVRCALERLCDHARVRKSDGRRALTLHARLERLPKRFDSVRANLLAVKHLGNDGSHRDGTTEDVLDAFEVLNHVLTVLYGARTDDVATISDDVNRKRGSRHRRANRR